jgi:hypothetical protein
MLPRPTARRWVALAAAASTTLAASTTAGWAIARPDGDEWVTICHRTNSTNNPYVTITVKKSAVDGANGRGEGQGDHYGVHTGPVWNSLMSNGGDWGDIIPPVTGAHKGLNWDALGEAIWEAGCYAASVSTAKVTDTDNDGTPDASDHDDDGDGIPDITDPSTDTDGDGIADATDPDDDNDGIPDVTDPDDDNDGTPDVTDPDDDNDGTPDITDPDADPDGDGNPNLTDPDNDGDGIPDTQEPDLDNDGTPNSSDPDDDGDGNPDTTDPDDDNDGTPESIFNPDSDRDATPDATDPDDDNDGKRDGKDTDSNGDGIPEDEKQVLIDPAVPNRVKPGTDAVFGGPDDVTSGGRQVTYRATCSAVSTPRLAPRGDIDGGNPAPLCVMTTRGDQLTVRVISADPVKVRVIASSGAVATYKGYRQVYLFKT